MKNRARFIWLPIIFFQCSTLNNSAYTETSDSRYPVSDKTFEEFFDLFCASPDFQISRIKFPLKDFFLEPGDDGIRDQLTVHELKQADWEYTNFKLDSLNLYTETDQFSAYIRKVNRKQIKYIRNGINNGIHIVYLFEREKQAWHLTQIVDTSN